MYYRYGNNKAIKRPAYCYKKSRIKYRYIKIRLILFSFYFICHYFGLKIEREFPAILLLNPVTLAQQ